MSGKSKGVDLEGLEKLNPQPAGDNYLLVIAIDEYMHCPKLSNCVSDAEAFIKVMCNKYNCSVDSIYTLYNEQASRKAIFHTLKVLQKEINSEDNLMIYFSGHGEVDEEEAFWVPFDGETEDDSTWVTAHNIKRHLNKINPFHLLVFVDACFSGSFFITYKDVSVKYLNRKRSRMGISASHSRERALDGNPGENSPFAKELLRLLTENTQPLAVNTLFDEVRVAVLTATKGRQTPYSSRLDIKGDDQGHFVFIPNEDEKTAWQRYRAQGASALRQFLALFPNGQYADDAREQLAIKEEVQLWEKAQEENTINAYYNYIESYPEGGYYVAAREAIKGLEDESDWKSVKSRGTLDASLDYLQKHPEGKYITEAKALRDRQMKHREAEQKSQEDANR